MVHTRRSGSIRAAIESFFVVAGLLGVIVSLMLWSNVVELYFRPRTSCPTGTAISRFSCATVVVGRVVVRVGRIDVRTDDQRILDDAWFAQALFNAMIALKITSVCLCIWWVMDQCSSEDRRPPLVEPSKVSPEVSVV